MVRRIVTLQTIVMLLTVIVRDADVMPIGPHDKEITQHLSRISKLIDAMLNTTGCIDGEPIPAYDSTIPEDASPLTDVDPPSTASSSTPSPPSSSSSSSTPSPSSSSSSSTPSPSSSSSSTPSPFSDSSTPSPSSDSDSSSTPSPSSSSSTPSPSDSSSSTPSPPSSSSSTPSPSSSSSSTPSPPSSSSTPSPPSSSSSSSTPSPSSSSSSTPSPSSTTPPAECEYSDFSPNHTALLPPKPECEIHRTGLSEEEKKEILDLHNQLRVKVARGEETRGDPGPQPPAANMRELIWNDELAQVAQAWASQCPFGHDSYRNRKVCTRDYEVGQNIHYNWGYVPDPDWQRAINHWYDEVKDFSHEVVDAFKKHPTKEIGHYTQVAWASTREVGCGVIYYLTEKQGKIFPNSKIYVCNYGESGNVRNRSLYTQGPAASACTEGISENYPELCS